MVGSEDGDLDVAMRGEFTAERERAFVVLIGELNRCGVRERSGVGGAHR